MGILRNLDFAKWLLLGLLTGGIGVAVCASLDIRAAWIMAAVTAVQLSLFVFYTMRRYQKIAALSDTLKSVNAGNYTLNAGDGAEGELSILQSEIYKTTLTLREQSECLKAEKEQLSDSLSDISHQLRTPLTSMSVMTELLCDGTIGDEQRRQFTSRLRAQLERLQWLVESLLKLSKLDAGAAQFKVEDIPAVTLLQRACEPLRIPAELRNVALKTEPDGRAVHCDPKWTAEALLNLLKNCVEHTPSGGMVCARVCTNPLYTEFTVSDTGPGFDREDLPHLFTRFYRGKNAAEGGVGIGLAMARSIARSQGGTITAQNGPNGGALFIMRLPRTGAGV